LELTKIEVARRQLETAVQLYFDDGDEISMHTLAAAGSEVLRGLCDARDGSVRTMRDWALDHVEPEHRKQFASELAASQNFFKHADRDPDGVLVFGSNEVQARLLDACAVYRKIAAQGSAVLQAYEIYAAITWARHMVKDDWLEGLSTPNLESMPKAEFYKAYMATQTA